MNKKFLVLIHIAVWMMMFISPMMFMNNGYGIDPLQFVFISIAPLALMLVFYVDYLWLTPRYLAKGKMKVYLTANIVMIVALGIGTHYFMDATHGMFDPGRKPAGPPPVYDMRYVAMNLFFILRNIFNLAISAAIATTIQLAMRWQASENARKTAEAERTAAELKNLRQQINPHFLLNTLNNIYALTAFNTEKAQTAIQELSKLLRHVLYDNQQEYVNLDSEAQLLTNYTNLMKIRLGNNVDVKLDIQLPTPCDIMISPLIFISLVENAFKHGVSPTLPSFIHISLTASSEKIVCEIANSNYPKAQTDRSGHGIGLQQVADRLEMMYKGKYKWEKKLDEQKTIYTSKITIYDTKLRNN